MKKFLSVLLAVLFCICVFPVFASAANEDIIASVKGGTAQIGGTVTLPISLDVNKGFVTLGLKVSYDADVLEIVCPNHKEGGKNCSPSIEKVSFASGNQGFNSQYHTNNPYRIQWAYGIITKDICETGQIASVTFRVKNTAKLGETKVRVDIDQASCYSKVRRTFIGGEATIKLVCANHTDDAGVVTKKPTCTEKGVKSYNCTVCGAVARTEDINPIGHSFGAWTKTVASTCTEAGTETRVCSNDANHKEIKEIKALGHSFGAWTKTVAPTCTEAGIETRVCSNDANHKETKEIKALGHSFGAWTKTVAPTCAEAGTEARVCSNDANHKETKEIKALAHNFGAWQVTKEPTVTSEGKRTGKCSVCGTSITETVPQLTTTIADDKLVLITDNNDNKEEQEEQKPAEGFKVDSTEQETFSGYVKGEIKETFPKSNNPITVGNKTVAAIYDIILRDSDNGKIISGDKTVVLTIPVRESIRSAYENIVLAREDANGNYVIINGAKLSNGKFIITDKYGNISKLLIAGDKIAVDETVNAEQETQSDVSSEINVESTSQSSDNSSKQEQVENEPKNPPSKGINTTILAVVIAVVLAAALTIVVVFMKKSF